MLDGVFQSVCKSKGQNENRSNHTLVDITKNRARANWSFTGGAHCCWWQRQTFPGRILFYAFQLLIYEGIHRGSGVPCVQIPVFQGLPSWYCAPLSVVEEAAAANKLITQPDKEAAPDSNVGTYRAADDPRVESGANKDANCSRCVKWVWFGQTPFDAESKFNRTLAQQKRIKKRIKLTYSKWK